MAKKNDIKMYSMHNEGKPVVAEISIRTLKKKFKKTLSIDKLDDIVNKYINTIIAQLK